MIRRLFASVLICAAPAVAHAQNNRERAEVIARAQVWEAGDIAAKDLRRGPDGPGALPPGATVTCTYIDKELDGRSAKFACVLGDDDEVKVKYGGDNGEVYGEVAASRLLWALGFGADRMYPARVICRNCPDTIGTPAGDGQRLVDPAVIERKTEGEEAPPGGHDAGWSWAEIDRIDEQSGGATRAQRDALKLIAVMLQHTDTKPEQQRLICRDGGPAAFDSAQARKAGPHDGNGPAEAGPHECARPFMLINDLGLTFGRANVGNRNAVGSVNFREWAATPVWKSDDACVGNLPKSLSGTLKDPPISEEGRQFAAVLLAQLSDDQIGDLFEAAKVYRREAVDQHEDNAPVPVNEWVDAFKRKRAEIADHRCVEGWSATAPPTFGTGTILWLQSRASPTLTRIMNAVSILAYTPVLIAIGVLLAFTVRLRAGAALLLLLALTAMVTQSTKAVVSFPPPDVADPRIESITEFLDDQEMHSFPSGHVAAATAFFFGLGYFFKWRTAWPAMLIWVPIIGLSRMYLGRHFAGDILGGVAIAVIVTAIALQGLTLRRLENPARAPGVARRLLLVGAILAALALWIATPDPHNAGRFLGYAVATAVLVGMAETASRPPVAIARRVALSAALFIAVWAGSSAVLDGLDLVQQPVGIFLAAALPAAVVLPGPLLVERLFTRS